MFIAVRAFAGEDSSATILREGRWEAASGGRGVLEAEV